MGDIGYTRKHEWIEVDGNVGTMGVTERLSLLYGKVLDLELPDVGDGFEQGEVMGTLEFVSGETYAFRAPLSGEIIAVNEKLIEEPDLLNLSPEEAGWICKMQIEDLDEFEVLMNREDYELFEEEEQDLEDEFDEALDYEL